MSLGGCYISPGWVKTSNPQYLDGSGHTINGMTTWTTLQSLSRAYVQIISALLCPSLIVHAYFIPGIGQGSGSGLSKRHPATVPSDLELRLSITGPGPRSEVSKSPAPTTRPRKRSLPNRLSLVSVVCTAVR